MDNSDNPARSATIAGHALTFSQATPPGEATELATSKLPNHHVRRRLMMKDMPKKSILGVPCQWLGTENASIST